MKHDDPGSIRIFGARQHNLKNLDVAFKTGELTVVTGPSGSDFDVYLQKLNGSTWTTVVAAETSSSNETITYSASSGTYRWKVSAYSGSGSLTLTETK